MFNVQCVTMFLPYCCYLPNHKNKLQTIKKISEDTPQAYRSGGRSEKVSEDTPQGVPQRRLDGVKERGFQKGEN